MKTFLTYLAGFASLSSTTLAAAPTTITYTTMTYAAGATAGPCPASDTITVNGCSIQGFNARCPKTVCLTLSAVALEAPATCSGRTDGTTATVTTTCQCGCPTLTEVVYGSAGGGGGGGSGGTSAPVSGSTQPTEASQSVRSSATGTYGSGGGAGAGGSSSAGGAEDTGVASPTGASTTGNETVSQSGTPSAGPNTNGGIRLKATVAELVLLCAGLAIFL